jgi:tRNA-specific 2-thiouridylase
MTKERVVVAMSGGVDSSVAAALLVEQGYDVVGIMLRLWSWAHDGQGAVNRCCALGAQYEAERIAEALDIPFYLVDAAVPFKHRVVDYFTNEYASGRTPNPCVECNRHIRFDLLLKRAMALGASGLATGHYARIAIADGQYHLMRAADRDKDQSYVLHTLDQNQLGRVRFPVGELTKSQVRAFAGARGLTVAQRRDSQDLCFVGDRGYHSFLEEALGPRIKPGPIRNTAGRRVGEHQGLVHYTVGQRKGIPVNSSERLYVIALDASENALVVGTADELGRRVCFAHSFHWIAGEAPQVAFDATAKIRYKARDAVAWVQVLDADAVRVEFEKPQRDITPGQALVLYQDDTVLGGGTIHLAQRR